MSRSTSRYGRYAPKTSAHEVLLGRSTGHSPARWSAGPPTRRRVVVCPSRYSSSTVRRRGSRDGRPIGSFRPDCLPGSSCVRRHGRYRVVGRRLRLHALLAHSACGEHHLRVAMDPRSPAAQITGNYADRRVAACCSRTDLCTSSTMASAPTRWKTCQAKHTGWKGLLDGQRAYLDDYQDQADVVIEGDMDCSSRCASRCFLPAGSGARRAAGFPRGADGFGLRRSHLLGLGGVRAQC